MGLVTYTLAPRCLLVAYKSALTPMSTFTTARRDTSGSVTRYKAFHLRIGYRSRFSHNAEVATPGYYSVMLSDYGVKAEMTSAVRSGMLRFTYPKSSDAFVLVDMNHTLWQKCVW